MPAEWEGTRLCMSATARCAMFSSRSSGNGSSNWLATCSYMGFSTTLGTQSVGKLTFRSHLPSPARHQLAHVIAISRSGSGQKECCFAS